MTGKTYVCGCPCHAANDKALKELISMQHGTVQMYRKELREKKNGGSGPCDACKQAQAKYISEYRAVNGRDRASETGLGKIRRKAMMRLAEEYPERFAALVEEETALATLL